MTPSSILFSSPCKDNGICYNPNCETAVAQFHGGTDGYENYDGRWYITLGHAGFNSPANNAGGYSSKAKALAAMRRYLKK
jgi:hypothetical protein